MIAALFLLCLLLPDIGFAEDLQKGAQELIAALELEALGKAAAESGWFEEGIVQVLGRLASGQMVLSA